MAKKRRKHGIPHQVPLSLTPEQKKRYGRLEVEQAVYVPSTRDRTKRITSRELNARGNKVRKYMDSTFGGDSTIQHSGGYTDKKGRLVKEKGLKVVSFADERQYKKNKKKLFRKLEGYADKWGQESIGYEYEGDLLFIPPTARKKRKSLSRKQRAELLRNLKKARIAAKRMRRR